MDLETVKKLIKKYTIGHDEVVAKALKAESYYRNKTDILLNDKKKCDEEESPLRNADNRVCSSFYSLLVNQKASYIFTSPPLFDVGNGSANEIIAKTLGGIFAKRCKDLCINAANGGISWLHYWKDSDNNFRYGVLDCKQVIPIWSDELDKRLIGVLRVYTQIDEETGKKYYVYEIWNDNECSAYRREADDTEYIIMPYLCFSICNTIGNEVYDNVYTHDFGRVPFIPFMNNNIASSDLDNIKGLIDTYDKTYSGFANDLEDIQEIIFVVSGYGGTNLKEFLTDLKKYKTVNIDSDGESGTNGGLSTLTIDIPVEARKQLLDMTRKAIFEQGQGVDPDPQKFGNTSGEALKYLYSLLELKSGLLETEFRSSFEELVNVICEYNGIKCENVIQTWTRTSISNDTETTDIAKNSVGIISKRTILEHHPFVENADEELSRLKEEESEDDIMDIVTKQDMNDE